MCQYLRWHFFKKKQNQMNDKNLERALNNVLSEVADICYMLTQKIEELENDLVELEKQHEQSLKVAFEKGYEEGVKYTDGLISNERFPF
jgi:phage shock protein A